MCFMANPRFTNPTSAQRPLGNAVPPPRPGESGPEKAELHPIGGLRPKLFYERYGMLESPFGVTPNPRYLYQSRTHAEARSSLIIGIECGVGFQALIAPPGMGKTTILFNLLEQFNRVARTAFLFQIQGNSRDFLHYLISELGGEPRHSDPVRMQDTINHLLISERRAGRQTIVIIDEAQGLDTSVLETLRLLSNFETPTEKLVQIILAGQPQLAQRLATAELAQLYQRISIRTTLIPFDLEDTRNYIEHRLRVASYPGPPLFTPAAVRAIWQRSGGVPREINTLCFNALLLATAVERKQIDSDILREVVADLDLNPIPFNKDTPPRSIRDVPTADVLQLGDAAADPPATRIDKTCKAVVPGAKAKADDASTSNGVDLVQLGTIVAETGPVSRIDRAEQTATRGTEAGADEVVVGAALPDRPALASDRKTDVVRSAGPRVAGLPSWETKATGNSTEVPHFTPEALDADRANGAATRVHLKQFFLTNSVWIAAIAAVVMVGSSLVHQHTGSAHTARTPVRMPQQARRTVNSTMDQIPTESSARETAVDENPAPRTTVEKSSEKLPNVGKIPNTEDNATAVSGNVVSSRGAASADNRAGLIAKIVSARLIHKVKPVYPPAAVEARIQGSVVLQALVDKDGAVRDVRFISGPPVLAPAAIDAVKQWQYRPADLNGQPFEWESMVTVKFRLR
jgi:general secretion pathway protein A